MMRTLTTLTLLALTACSGGNYTAEREAVHKSLRTHMFTAEKPNAGEEALVHALYTNLKPEFTAQQKCEVLLGTTWQQAKAGNLEARLMLVFLSGYAGLYLRGPELGREMSLTDNKTLTLHSIGSRLWQEQAGDTSGYNDDLDELLPNDAALRGCAKNTPSPACTAIAVERGYTPTFAAFAAEVESSAPHGIKQACAAVQ